MLGDIGGQKTTETSARVRSDRPSLFVLELSQRWPKDIR